MSLATALIADTFAAACALWAIGGAPRSGIAIARRLASNLQARRGLVPTRRDVFPSDSAPDGARMTQRGR